MDRPDAAAAPLDPTPVVRHVDAAWSAAVVPALVDYIRVPAVSVAFDPDWAAHGHLDRVVEEAAAWARSRPVAGLVVEVVRLPGRTPVLVFEVPASPGAEDRTVLLYGHLDKQPPMTGWRDGLGPWDPVIDGDRLYGRGGADDGYALYASITAIEAVQAAGGRHGRCIGLIECSEESGSPDLPAYVEHLAPRLGRPGLVVCLDSFCGDYAGLWTTTSLRGLLSGTVTVEVVTEGLHSGSVGGLVPDSFRIARHLLDRIEDPATGRVLVAELWAEVPAGRTREMDAVAAAVGSALTAHHPYVDGAGPMVGDDDPVGQIRARTWEPALAVVGADGLPPTGSAGNVLRPSTTLALSLRLPPTVDAAVAADAVRRRLEADPPYGARVVASFPSAESGWDAPPTAPWLAASLDRASRATFGAPARQLGEGGSIPFMGMLGRRFPGAQYVLTGVLGPGSNAHGPNEFLHLPTGRAVTATVALVLHDHATSVR